MLAPARHLVAVDALPIGVGGAAMYGSGSGRGIGRGAQDQGEDQGDWSLESWSECLTGG